MLNYRRFLHTQKTKNILQHYGTILSDPKVTKTVNAAAQVVIPSQTEDCLTLLFTGKVVLVLV
jgi:hypothetical protein